ncbi:MULTISPECIES: head decoration protein [unclassified Duganella]|uniref:head decoration protein n=1 Tax=unclassified Duganella TaxID=2636909 RepID=UPI00088E2FD6|nr:MULTISPECIES: head decoration protein [unclassified Duganella]SDH05889.1 Bacteriophage lambda head decoration protein D [Duganella sp. OV458]SDK20211.1 Bacteriophage lambda head decoration protein D [Duganella sp. OV510]
MPLATTNVGANPQAPGAVAQVYVPDQLFAGHLKPVTDAIVLGAGNLQRGAVLGQVTATGNYILCVKTANDGSQIPSAILADAADASGGAVPAGAYLTGEFNVNALIFDASWTATQVKAAARSLSIFVKNVVGAADPT